MTGRAAEFISEQDARKAIVRACRSLESTGLNQGRAGNISVRWHRGGRYGAGLLVTPAALAYDRMEADDVVWMPLQAASHVHPGSSESLQALGPHPGCAPELGSGERRPSSESALHRDVYVNRATVNAVIHVHSPYATALACLARIQRDGIPAFHYMIAVAGGSDVRCAPYRTYGTDELSEVALRALDERFACLLANHGSVALGATLEAALELAGEVEQLARMYAIALQVGEPVLLDEEEIARVRARFLAGGRLPIAETPRRHEGNDEHRPDG